MKSVFYIDGIYVVQRALPATRWSDIREFYRSSDPEKFGCFLSRLPFLFSLFLSLFFALVYETRRNSIPWLASLFSTLGLYKGVYKKLYWLRSGARVAHCFSYSYWRESFFLCLPLLLYFVFSLYFLFFPSNWSRPISSVFAFTASFQRLHLFLSLSLARALSNENVFAV